MGLTLGLIIDRIRITGLELSSDQYSLFKKLLPEIIKLYKKEYSNTHGNLTVYYHEYKAAVQYRDDHMQSIARLEAGTTKKGHRYLAWELWPHRIPGSNFSELCELIYKLLENPIFQYQFAYEHGKVRCIELASDVLTTQMHTFIPWIKNVKNSSIYDPSWTKGQIQIGSKNSPRSYSIYDKARQLKEKKLPNPYKTRTRIEAVLRCTKLSPKDLNSIKNPFSDLHIVDTKTARLLTSDLKFQDFLSYAEYYGSARAFAAITKSQRVEIRKKLMLCSATWWNPSFIWKSHEKAISILKPSNIFMH